MAPPRQKNKGRPTQYLLLGLWLSVELGEFLWEVTYILMSLFAYMNLKAILTLVTLVADFNKLANSKWLMRLSLPKNHTLISKKSIIL